MNGQDRRNAKEIREDLHVAFIWRRLTLSPQKLYGVNPVVVVIAAVVLFVVFEIVAVAVVVVQYDSCLVVLAVMLQFPAEFISARRMSNQHLI